MEISIIIPTLNEAQSIGRLIRHLLSNITETYEIIVVDGGSTDDTIEICKKLNATIIHSDRSRSIQQNAGAKMAKYDYLYFVHADTLPPDSIQEDLRACIENGCLAACYRSKYESKSPLLKVNAFFTRFYWLVSRGGDQSLLVKKEVFFENGGFDEKSVIMEEYPFLEKLMKTNSLTIIPKGILISTRKYENRSWFKVSRANYRAFKLFKKGADSEVIRQVYKDSLK